MPVYDPQRHHRRSIRLQNYDYAQSGAYFVTLVTHAREHLFGTIDCSAMKASLAGECAEAVLQSLPERFPVELDEWVVMPNHLHVILVIHSSAHESLNPTSTPHGTQPNSLGAIVQNYKSVTTYRINTLRKSPGEAVWLRNYYEHVIRNEDELSRIRQYIADNPLRWDEDEYGLNTRHLT